MEMYTSVVKWMTFIIEDLNSKLDFTNGFFESQIVVLDL